MKPNTIDIGKLRITGPQLGELLKRLGISIYQIEKESKVPAQTISNFINKRGEKPKSITTDTWNRIVAAMVKIKADKKGAEK